MLAGRVRLGLAALTMMTACTAPAVPALDGPAPTPNIETSDGGAPSVPDSSAPDADVTSPPDAAAGDSALDAACTPIVEVDIKDTGPNGVLVATKVPDLPALIKDVGRKICRVLYRKPEEIRGPLDIDARFEASAGPHVSTGARGSNGTMFVINTNHLAIENAEGNDLRTEIERLTLLHVTSLYQYRDETPGDANLSDVVRGVEYAVQFRIAPVPSEAEPKKSGSWMDARVDHLAFFFLWLDGRYPDFLYRLNQSMVTDSKQWTPEAFRTITGRGVEELWSTYGTAACCSTTDTSCCQ